MHTSAGLHFASEHASCRLQGVAATATPATLLMCLLPTCSWRIRRGISVDLLLVITLRISHYALNFGIFFWSSGVRPETCGTMVFLADFYDGEKSAFIANPRGMQEPHCVPSFNSIKPGSHGYYGTMCQGRWAVSFRTLARAPQSTSIPRET